MAHGKKMSGQIFINYRRDDSAAWTGRLSDRLSNHFPSNQIFMDVDLDAGVDFIEAIGESVGSCDVLIAVIGTRWLISSDAEGRRRLDNPEDFVRIEIATALKRGIRVIPVLVEGASMPRSRDLPDDLKSLVRRNALEVSHSRFRADSERLIDAVERALETARAEQQRKREEEQRLDEREEKERLETERREIQAKERLEPERPHKGEPERLEAKARQRKEEERLKAEQSERENAEAERRLWSRLYFATAACALGIYLFGVLSYGSNPHSRYIEIREIGATSFECSFVPALISAFGLFLHLKRPRFKVTKMLFGWIVAFLFLVSPVSFIDKQINPWGLWGALASIFQSFSAVIATSFLFIRSPNGSRAAEFVHAKSPRNGKTN